MGCLNMGRIRQKGSAMVPVAATGVKSNCRGRVRQANAPPPDIGGGAFVERLRQSPMGVIAVDHRAIS